ncbi:hypothetical protein A0H81_13028 [Grifola frondosa]|uniref:DUF6535 domain-containing protein n=1 Tax=Grifola frondosa TaxID=5627 RepID=A0A1C7LR73_GRIFR|nr:hypothetical protein A0H81_13028 [Grifola frondosa]
MSVLFPSRQMHVLPQATGIPDRTSHSGPFKTQKVDDENTPPCPKRDGEDTASAWSRCAGVLSDYDRSLVQGWKEEIDMLLVFAGLFSAVLTAFNVQSYQMLQPDPTDTPVALLAQISAQLNSFAISTAFVNSTHPISSTSNPGSTFQAAPFAVRVNVMWFASLICSLAAASIAIMVKQWINQFTHGLVGASLSHETARLRQYRYDSLVKWRVFEIMTLLPLLLQIALALFLVGLLDLLWNLHPTVAIVSTVLVVILLLFSVITISPQALGIFLLVQGVLRVYRASCRLIYSVLVQDWVSSLASRMNGHWDDYLSALRRCSVGYAYCSWRTAKEMSVRDEGSVLDQHLLVAADAITMDDDFLENTVEPCFHTIAPEVAVPCYYDMLLNRADRLDALVETWTHDRGTKSVNAVLRLTLCLLEKLVAGGDDYVENQLRILTLSWTLWSRVGTVESAYPVTARFLNRVATMFMNQADDRSIIASYIFFTVIRERDLAPIGRDVLRTTTSLITHLPEDDAGIEIFLKARELVGRSSPLSGSSRDSTVGSVPRRRFHAAMADIGNRSSYWCGTSPGSSRRRKPTAAVIVGVMTEKIVQLSDHLSVLAGIPVAKDPPRAFAIPEFGRGGDLDSDLPRNQPLHRATA